MCTRTPKKYLKNQDPGEQEENIAYIAGLFDGEGCISCLQRPTKRPDRNGKIYNQWYIRAEIAMTDESTVSWIHHTLNMGWSGPKRCLLYTSDAADE